MRRICTKEVWTRKKCPHMSLQRFKERGRQKTGQDRRGDVYSQLTVRGRDATEYGYYIFFPDLEHKAGLV